MPESQVFTDYLHSLDPSGKPPDAESFARLWQSLRGVLASELRSRGLWRSPPSYLGIYGFSQWPAPGSNQGSSETGSAARPTDALDELAASCYTYVFLRRSRSLRAQLQLKSNVDGLVFRSLRNFLYDTQRRHDPMGYRIFAILKKAVDLCLKSQTLHLIEGGPKIGNDAILAFDLEAELPPAANSTLEALVRSWNDHLLPDLITARGRDQEALVAKLEGLLTNLPDQGFEVFRFQDLIEPLKAEARARWAELLDGEAGERAFEGAGDEPARLVAALKPDSRFEDRDSFENLVRCVTQGLDSLEASKSTQRHLSTLWNFLRIHANQSEEAATSPDNAFTEAARQETLPSRRKLSQLLGIPRDRFPELFTTLGSLISQCQASTSTKRPVSPRQRPLTAGHALRVSPMNIHNLHRELRQRTGETLLQDSRLEEELANRKASPPEPGDIYLLPSASPGGLEWVVLDSSKGDRSQRSRADPLKFLLIPADTVPLIGPGDVEITAESASGPLSLRCQFGAWLEAERLRSAQRTGVLEEEDLAHAQQAYKAVEAGELEASSLELEVECDPEYQEWRQELAKARDSLIPAPLAEVIPARPWRNLISHPLGLAASVLLMVSLASLAWEHGHNQDLRDRLANTEVQKQESERRLRESELQQMLLSTQLEHAMKELGGKDKALDEERRKFSVTLAALNRKKSEPMVNLASKSLGWEGSERGSAGNFSEFVVSKDASGYALWLAIPTEEPSGILYELDILHINNIHNEDQPQGRAALNLRGLKNSGECDSSVVLRRDELPAGQYELRLYRQDADKKAPPVQRYFLDLILE